MDFEVGDIVFFENAVAGKAKYHFCFVFNDVNSKYGFMFLNSEGVFEDHFVVDCTRIPNMPKSRSGQTVFSCPTVMHKTKAEISRLNPERMCRLPADVALELLSFSYGIETLPRTMLESLQNTLAQLCES
jgi:hypothetical protein